MGKLIVLAALLALVLYFFYRPRGGPDDRGKRLPRPEPETPKDVIDNDSDDKPELEPADATDKGDRGR